jgi:hypothetical protein
MGEPIKNTVYFKLENDRNIPKREIPNRVDEFADFLNKTFGLDASFFEIKCMQCLHSKIDVKIIMIEDNWSLSKWIIDGMTFEKYVSCARNNYCKP